MQVFLEKKRHEAEEKKYKSTVESKFALKGSKNGILFFPAWVGNNPYQKLLYEAINKKNDISVSGHAKEALCERFLKEKRNSYDYIHLHWLQAFIDFSDDAGADNLVSILTYAKSIGYKIIYTAHNITSHDTEFAEREVVLRKKVAKLFDYALVQW
ncbi:hypothetical protein [Arsukibacterium sp.]|uniref:hypothetical protein n=1 Tax=Arsukibacterium sp. TaxID=1977258 RepID=UPI001BD48515|nr:hypothetical protein [Arsukibacterium sp.]